MEKEAHHSILEGPDLSDRESLKFSRIGRNSASPSYRSEAILIRLMDGALGCPKHSQEKLQKRARKLLNGIARHGEAAVPTNELELVCWSGLSRPEEIEPLAEVIEIAAASKRTERTTSRHFKNCIACGRKFLPSRSDAKFDSPKCRLRWKRQNESSHQAA